MENNKLLEYVNYCLLSKLSKDYHENEIHAEFQRRNNQLKDNFEKLLNLLENEDFTQQREIDSIKLSYLLILYLELQSVGPWNAGDTKQYCNKLRNVLNNVHNIDLENDLFNSQIVFDKCIEELHKKMKLNDFKKYPGLIEVYCLLVKDLVKYNITLNPVTVLPVALLLIDDYITANKIKGLLSCMAILKCLNINDFTAGNYYEVVYSSLKKNIGEKDKEVSQSLFQCCLQFLKIVPPDVKSTKLDDIFSSVLDQLHTESNLYRKADFFDFMTKIIEIHKIHCAKRKVFKDIIRDNVDICSNESVCEILLLHVLKCFQMWLRYCWCIWKLPADHKILTALFKILYLSKDENTTLMIQNIISSLITLCGIDERRTILDNLGQPLKNCSNQDFMIRLEAIKKQINIDNIGEVCM